MTESFHKFLLSAASSACNARTRKVSNSSLSILDLTEAD